VTAPARLPGRLGRRPNDPARPRLRLSEFARPAPPPASADWYSGVPVWPMYLNDQLGDCTCAEVGHQIESASVYAGAEIQVTDSDVLALYERAGGYVPGDPSTDQGAAIQDVLGVWRKTGVAGHKCLAFAEVTVANTYQARQAVADFGSLDLGVTICAGDLAAFSDGRPWTTSYDAGAVEGGHSVEMAGYDGLGGWAVTWGALQRFTWQWWWARVEEAWLVIQPEWLAASGDSPSGFDLYQLGQAMHALTGDPNPFPPPAPAP